MFADGSSTDVTLEVALKSSTRQNVNMELHTVHTSANAKLHTSHMHIEVSLHFHVMEKFDVCL